MRIQAVRTADPVHLEPVYISLLRLYWKQRRDVHSRKLLRHYLRKLREARSIHS